MLEIELPQVIDEPRRGGHLELDDRAGMGADRQQCLVEGRNPDAGKAPVHLGAGIKAAEVEQVELVDASVAGGRAIDGLVMDDDHLAIGGNAQVELDGAGPEAHRLIKGGDGVLRGISRGAAVGDGEDGTAGHTQWSIDRGERRARGKGRAGEEQI